LNAAILGAVLASAPVVGPGADPSACAGALHFTIRNPDDIIMATHDGHLALPYIPEQIERLAGPGTEKALVLVGRLRNAAGVVVGLGTQMEYFDAVRDREGRWLTHTSWTLQLPGSGTIYAFEHEDIPEALTSQLRDARASGKTWTGLIEAQTSAGPRSDGKGVVVGGSGAFEGAAGAFIELNSFHRIADGNMFGTVTLSLVDLVTPRCNRRRETESTAPGK
jgi:hypothetical protein